MTTRFQHPHDVEAIYAALVQSKLPPWDEMPDDFQRIVMLLADNQRELEAFVSGDVGNSGTGAEVHATSNKNVTSPSWTSASYQVVDYDSGGYFSSSNDTRLTVPSGAAGRYTIFFSGALERNVNGQRAIRILKNGSIGLVTHTHDAVSDVNIWTHMAIAHSVFLADGDYLEGQLYNNSGSTLAIDSSTGAGNCDQQARLSVVRVL